ncbi:MAG: glycosyl hydrolase family 18 protein [Lachnospiraceae bacterium]|jgi:spore germination protein
MIYVVKAGDTLQKIAAEFQTTEARLLYDNQLYEQPYLVVGQALWIQAGDEKEQIRDMYVNGYAYPFIQPSVLQESLSVLDELLVFSYGFTPEGELIPPPLSDLPLIETAWQQGVRPVLVLTPFGVDGQFNNYLVKAVVENAELQERLIENLLFTVKNQGYTGVDVDFEFILPEDRELYAQFVGNLRTVMNANGYTVTVALAPKISADQPGLLYEGMDFALLGESADHVFLMTYEWGYKYGPPMAVAPLNKVRQVLDYAITEISAYKIVMGIPNYAYDWPLPFIQGETQANLIGNVEAVQLAAQYGAEILYDPVAQSPYFTYQTGGVMHEVWFEDVRSMDAKLRTADSYGFYGVGYWNLMRPFRANWLMLASLMGKL